MGIAARKMKISMPAGMAIDAEVDLCLSNDAYFLRARLNVSLPGLEPDIARDLIESGHRTCPTQKQRAAILTCSSTSSKRIRRAGYR